MSVFQIFQIFQIIQQFFYFDDFIFGPMGNWEALLTSNFWYLGNIFKKSVGDLIFYYDSTYKI